MNSVPLHRPPPFHFAAIEQGGSSLYNSFMTKVTNLDVVGILASIGPMEVYHFAVFQTALERIRKLEGHEDPSFPDIRENPNRGDIMPEPCTFLDKTCPSAPSSGPATTNTAGAVAAATGLVNSGLFLGQSQAFFDAVVPLAKAGGRRTPKLKAGCQRKPIAGERHLFGDFIDESEKFALSGAAAIKHKGRTMTAVKLETPAA